MNEVPCCVASMRRLPTEAGPADAALQWTNLGPTNSAGRVSAVAVEPANASIIYRGTAGGGVWKSTDGGAKWTSLTDNLGNLSIGAIAVAPSSPSTIYVGTGEGVLSVDGIDGIGFIKSRLWRSRCRSLVLSASFSDSRDTQKINESGELEAGANRCEDDRCRGQAGPKPGMSAAAPPVPRT